jgi:hypothetical protein
VVISPEDYAKEALSNYVSSKIAYKAQLDKTRQLSDLARPSTSSQKMPLVSTAGSTGYSAEFAKVASENYHESKKLYNSMMEKTRRPTQFAGEPAIAGEVQSISAEVYATEARSNYIASKKAYRDMKDRQ